MKVKTLIEKLQRCNPELDVAYEHCYIDYVQELSEEGIIEMGDARPTHYSSWIPINEREPEDKDRPILVAVYYGSEWHYYTEDNLFCGIGTAGKMKGKWMPIEKTQEHILQEIGYSEAEIEEQLNLEKDDQGL